MKITVDYLRTYQAITRAMAQARADLLKWGCDPSVLRKCERLIADRLRVQFRMSACIRTGTEYHEVAP